MKECSKCRLVKPIKEFGKNKCTKDGRQYWCKRCRKARYEQDRSKVSQKAFNRRWPNGKPKFSTRVIDVTGQKFNKLTVLEITNKKAKDGSVIWRCRCDCGNLCESTSTILKHGGKKSCGCLFLESYEKRGKRYKKISGAYWANYRNHAKQAGREFSITMKQAWKIWEAQKEHCALSGVKLWFAECSALDGYKSQIASMDRIDSTKGYTKENVQWVHKEINIMKQSLTDEDFIEWCKIVSLYQEKKIK